jgi:hypothetical protein
VYKYPKMTKVMQKSRTYGKKLNKRENITAFCPDFTPKSKKGMPVLPKSKIGVKETDIGKR